MNLKEIHIAYFIGIGGIGMSALARWFHWHGITVCGYDKTPTPLTSQLIAEGIEVHYDDDISRLPDVLTPFNKNALIIYTPAVPMEHKEMNYLKDAGYEIKKRSQVLGIITRDKFTVAVAGTHGKTTTSSMISHLLRCAGISCEAFLGGITVNYGTNLLLGDKIGNENIVVVEADEYDRSFLTLHPNIAVITSADADHLDIYGDPQIMHDSFRKFIDQIDKNGHLFIKESIAANLISTTGKYPELHRYAIDGQFIFATDIKMSEGDFIFSYHGLGQTIPNIRLKVPGYHNLENALVSISVALILGISTTVAKEGIESYAGVKRRFEYIIKSEDLVLIDDYAHHPVEIEALLKSVRSLFPHKKITVIFQPHLFSRTRDFAEDFAASLSLADEVYLMDIYPARELPIEGVTSDIIFDSITAQSKVKCNAQNVLQLILTDKKEVVLTVGAGDIDKIVEPLKNLLNTNNHVE